MGIGIVYGLILNPGGFLLPIIILGGIFLLYKFPPSTWNTKSRSNQPYVKQNRTKPQQRPKSRRAPFRVINGGKDDKDDDDLPKYH